MDFSKIRPAVEDITLSDKQKEEILSACQGKKRKFNYKPLAFAAAAAVTLVVIASPGFLFRAKNADSAESIPQENANEDYHYVADEEIFDASVNNSSGSGATGNICIYADFTAFSAPDFIGLYSVIPAEFAPLAGDEDFSGWLSEISADDGMAIMQFVKRFNISRAEFDNANIAYAARTGNYFDADTIYTFDKELIDSLYRK